MGLTEIKLALQKRDLGSAINAMENHLATKVNMWGGEQLALVKNDYQLMVDFWLRGFDDPQRSALYDKLLKRLDAITMEMESREWMERAVLVDVIRRNLEKDGRDWSVENIERQLESFVSDVAMLELEKPHIKERKSEALYDGHKNLMNTLFNYVWTSGPWNDAQAEAFKSMLLSPTIDSLDQQLLVSAITLSLMNIFCFNKFRLLTDVYLNSPDDQLRQRALVGWVFGLDDSKVAVYPEMLQIVKDICSDGKCRQELSELQMQLVFCMQADSDSQTVSREIVPDIMKGNRLEMTRRGIVEMDEGTLDDILHPEKSEEEIEKMEKSIKRIADMQKQGSDIYYAGFSQMKRFSFFNSISNWFVPFYSNHPEISKIWNDSKNTRFLQLITKTGAFCDSDKYSFVLAFDQILRQLPESMLKAIREGDGIPMPVGGDFAVEEQNQPAFIRRVYLQNLYRFFMLYPQRSVFVNPFSVDKVVFFSNRLFHDTQLGEKMVHMSKFLAQHSMSKSIPRILSNVAEEYQDTEYHIACGNYKEALLLEPTNLRAKRGYARQLFEQKRFEEALKMFVEISESLPDNVSVSLNVAVCLSRLGRYDEALKILFRLNYEDASNVKVNRVLAWTLLLSGKNEQARKMYEDIVSGDSVAEDFLNYGYCLWIMKDVASAAGAFSRFVKDSNVGIGLLEDEFNETFNEMLAPHGLSFVDVQLMLYQVSNNL